MVRGLCAQLLGCVNEDGSDNIGYKFIDWPSSEDAEAQEYGIRALLKVAFESCREILDLCGDSEYASATEEALARLALRSLPPPRNKQAAALGVFAGVLVPRARGAGNFFLQRAGGAFHLPFAIISSAPAPGRETCAARSASCATITAACWIWAPPPCGRISTFPGKRAQKPIDSLLREGEYDVHGDNGGYCYKGYRHSLCHGWAAGTVRSRASSFSACGRRKGAKSSSSVPIWGIWNGRKENSPRNRAIWNCLAAKNMVK